MISSVVKNNETLSVLQPIEFNSCGYSRISLLYQMKECNHYKCPSLPNSVTSVSKSTFAFHFSVKDFGINIYLSVLTCMKMTT